MTLCTISLPHYANGKPEMVLSLAIASAKDWPGFVFQYIVDMADFFFQYIDTEKLFQ